MRKVPGYYCYFFELACACCLNGLEEFFAAVPSASVVVDNDGVYLVKSAVVVHPVSYPFKVVIFLVGVQDFEVGKNL